MQTLQMYMNETLAMIKDTDLLHKRKNNILFRIYFVWKL